MSISEIIELVIIVALTIGLVVTLIKDVISKKIKTFIEDCMVEAEQLGKTGTDKLTYVVEKVKSKYKILAIVSNIKVIVERVIELSKKINVK